MVFVEVIVMLILEKFLCLKLVVKVISCGLCWMVSVVMVVELIFLDRNVLMVILVCICLVIEFLSIVVILL